MTKNPEPDTIQDEIMDEVVRRAREHIKVAGRSIMSVFGDVDEPNFSYTVGNYQRGLPELLVFGLIGKPAGWLLNTLSERMIEQGEWLTETAVDLGGQYPVMVLPASDQAKKDCTVLATHMAQPDQYRLLQVVLCDTHGRFPWEPNCDAPYNGAPIYRVQ